MIKASYDPEYNVVIVEFEGRIDAAQAEQFFSDIEKVLPKHGKSFKLLTDLSLLQSMDPNVRGTIKKAMDFFNAKGVTQVVRVIPHPDQDIGFKIMSLFHYSKEVEILTVQSRGEAQARLKSEKK
ncbi:MAG: STAS domain-containing protein [Candidatus Omnitrophica bacterium]|nr:STAS domain-containing protein [Candidatus Omnitrophota bacterium]